MKLRRIRSTIKGPLILFVTGMVMVVALLILWNVVLAVDYQRLQTLAAKAEQTGEAGFHWAYISLGSVFFVAIIALFSILGAQLFSEIRFTQRLADFVATFTHELNSPLASIKLFAQTLKTPDLPEKDRDRFLELILADVERLRGQIANVLRAAQVDGPTGIQLALERVDLRQYLEDYREARVVLLERLPAKVGLSVADGPTATVDLDRQVFRQALDNVVDNAIKYARADGVQIELAVAECPGGLVALEVRDDGRGVQTDELEEIFARFHRAAPKAAARQPGTGLGLWIVDAIAQAHGGEVVATSPGPDQGTTIRFTLPPSLSPAASPHPREAIS